MSAPRSTAIPDNTDLLLWSDFIAPVVAIGLYAACQRASATATHSRRRHS